MLVRANGAIRHEASFGQANVPFDVANTPRTKYPIASITKLFTAIMVLRLNERSRLDLDGVIADYLPDYAGEGARTVTVRQLLNHTSGIINFDRVGDMATALRDGLPNYQTPYTSDRLLTKFCSGALVHAPGTTFDYNNCDYIILGKIVERLHGKPFDAVLAAEILRPLGLSDTGMRVQHRITAGLADTYFHRDDLGTLVPDLPAYPENWYAAGAMYSTAQDLLAFSDALFGGRLVNAGSLAQMLAPGLDDYGFGLWIYEMTVDGVPHRVAKRPGRIMGAQTQLFRFLDSDITIILLANAGRADLDEFVAEIARQTVRAKFKPSAHKPHPTW